jgi:hypothetical protein
MGLDVYLYRYDQPIDSVRTEQAEMEAAEEKIWSAAGNYDSLTDEQKKDVRSKIDAMNASAGWVKGEYSWRHPAEHRIEMKSAKHPDHMFEIGYYRSSYNSGGINSILKRMGCLDLNEIFDAGDYIFSPDWKASRDRAAAALEQFKAKNDGLDIEEVSIPIHLIEGDKAAILNKVREEITKKPFEEGSGWSNGTGTYFPGGREQVAIVYGKPGFLGTGIYVVTRNRPKDGEHNWYEQALEVVIESIDYVLAQPDPNVYCFHWSG